MISVFLKSGDRFLWSSWRDGHTHLYLYSFDKQNPLNADAKLERQLEKGDYEVLAVEGVDEQWPCTSLRTKATLADAACFR